MIDNAGSESIAVTKAGGGTQIFTGANTYAGGTTISAGTLQLGDGTTSNGSIVGNVADSGTLAFANPNSQTYAGNISGSGNVSKSAAGTLSVSGDQTFGGSLSVTNGTLLVTSTGSISGAGNIGVGTTGTAGQSTILRLDTSAVAQSGAATVTVGAASGSIGTLNIGTVSGGSVFTTGTGTLTINATGAVNVGAASAGGILNANGNATINGGKLAVAINSTFALGTGKTLTIQSGGSASIVPDYDAGMSTNYIVTGQGSSLAASGLFFLDGSDQLNVQSGAGTTFNVLYAGNDSGSGTINVGGAGSSLTASLIWCGISSTGTINVTAGGSLTTSGALNLNAGTVNVNGGAAIFPTINFEGATLNFIAGSLTTNQNLEVASSGLVLHNGTFNSGVINASPDLNASQQFTTAGSTTIDLGQTLTLDGGKLSTGSLVINGTLAFNSGTLAITGAGGLTVGSGGLFGSNLSIAAGQTLNITQTATVNAGSTLNVSSGSFTAGPFVNNGRTLDGGAMVVSSLSNNAGGYFFVGQNLIATVNGAAANAGEIQLGGADATLAGAGTLTNTGLIHGDGHLAINLTNASGGTIRVENGSVLNFDGSTTPNAGNVSLLGGAATFAKAFTNGAAGTITGHGGLIYNAGFTNLGSMQLSSGGTDIYGSVANSGAGSITTGSGSITTFYNNVSNSGAQIRTAAGGFTVFFGNVTGAGPFNGPGTVDFEGTYLPGGCGANVSFASNVALGNSGSIVVNQGGITEIDGAPTFYSGSSIQVASGKLRFANSAAATVESGVTATVSSGATLELAGTVSALSDASLSGGGNPSSGAGRVNIVNNSAVGLLVTGMNQQVGAVEGSGVTELAAGSDLTVDRIQQSSLLIGAGATLTIAPSNSSGLPLDLSPAAAASTSPDLADQLSSLETALGERKFDLLVDPSGASLADAGSTFLPSDDLAIDATAGIAAPMSAVPEPSTLCLTCAALIGFIAAGRRRRRFRSSHLRSDAALVFNSTLPNQRPINSA